MGIIYLLTRAIILTPDLGDGSPVHSLAAHSCGTHSRTETSHNSSILHTPVADGRRDAALLEHVTRQPLHVRVVGEVPHGPAVVVVTGS